MKNLTLANLHKVNRSIENMKKRYSRAMEKSEEVTEHIIHGSEAFASSFLFGLLQGRYADRGGIGIMGIPIELVIGVAGYVGATVGVGGALSEHLYPLATGALSAYATTLGRGVGAKTASVSAPKALTSTSVKGEAGLTAAELAALANPQ